MNDDLHVGMPWELFHRTIDHLWELEGHWNWSKDEPRVWYRNRYSVLMDDIKELERIRDTWVGDGNGLPDKNA